MLLVFPCVVPACAFLKFKPLLLVGGWDAASGGYCCLSSVSVLILTLLQTFPQRVEASFYPHFLPNGLFSFRGCDGRWGRGYWWPHKESIYLTQLKSLDKKAISPLNVVVSADSHLHTVSESEEAGLLVFLGKESNWGECGVLELGWRYRRKVCGIQVVVLWSF